MYSYLGIFVAYLIIACGYANFTGNRGADANCVLKFHQSGQLPTPSLQMPLMPGQPNLHQGILPNDHAKEETRTERNLSYELSKRSCGHSNYNPSESIPVKNLDLNVVLPIDSSDEETLPRSNEILNGKRKYREPNPDLPWLPGKPMGNVVFTITRNKLEPGLLEASYNPLLKDETVKDSNSLPIAASSSCHVKVDRGSALAAINNGTKNKGNRRGFDINVACNLVDAEFNKQIGEEAILSEKGNDTKVNNFRNIDLNSCVSEDEDILMSSVASTSGKVKIAFEIDLEAPAVQITADALFPVEEQKLPEVSLQSQLHKTEQQKDQAVRIAAETIVAISSYSRDPHIECTKLDHSELPDSLTWFADVISSSAEELERKLCKDYKVRNCREIDAPRELDDYEIMTLQLTQTREEDYMPEPFVPEIPNLEVGATSVPSRTRKGPARRGRIRKDFQRDVLPGLISLSRHEVTEDLQTFGELMRATGHQWNGGTTRRNDTRGRRRCIVDPSLPLLWLQSAIHHCQTLMVLKLE
ncbi:hypothetical protein ACET3Z_023706 [Daucus carota]